MASKKMGVLAEPPAAAKVENDYEAEDNARHLTKVGELMQDPLGMKKAMAHIRKTKNALKGTDRIAAFAQAKYGKGGTAPKDPHPDAGSSPETDGTELED
jgi:hypothetical protein